MHAIEDSTRRSLRRHENAMRVLRTSGRLAGRTRTLSCDRLDATIVLGLALGRAKRW